MADRRFHNLSIQRHLSLASPVGGADSGRGGQPLRMDAYPLAASTEIEGVRLHLALSRFGAGPSRVPHLLGVHNQIPLLLCAPRHRDSLVRGQSAAPARLDSSSNWANGTARARTCHCISRCLFETE